VKDWRDEAKYLQQKKLQERRMKGYVGELSLFSVKCEVLLRQNCTLLFKHGLFRSSSTTSCCRNIDLWVTPSVGAYCNFLHSTAGSRVSLQAKR